MKNPAEDHFRNEVTKASELGKPVVLAGCVPQGAPQASYIKGLSVIGVQQIDRVVEVVEETLKGTNEYTSRKRKLATLSRLLKYHSFSRLIKMLFVHPKDVHGLLALLCRSEVLWISETRKKVIFSGFCAVLNFQMLLLQVTT